MFQPNKAFPWRSSEGEAGAWPHLCTPTDGTHGPHCDSRCLTHQTTSSPSPRFASNSVEGLSKTRQCRVKIKSTLNSFPKAQTQSSRCCFSGFYSKWLTSPSRWSCNNPSSLFTGEIKEPLVKTTARLKWIMTTLQTDFQKFPALGQLGFSCV